MRLERIKRIKNKDIRGLAYCIHGMSMTSDRMKKANFEFLMDKYKKAKP